MPNPASPARTFYNDANDLFYMDIRYDQPFTGISGLTAAPAQKAGNISQIASRVRGREAQIMSYSYDYLSRLSSSTFHNYSDAGVISGTNNYNENLTYDLRGNIQTLQRTGFYTNGSTCTYGQIDNLTYSYTANTNRLHKVLDGTLTAGDAKSRGFNGLLSTVDNSMTYDRNGNLNKNLHKNVSTITYNHLNLPTVITFTTGNTIEFLYDAAGTKLRKTVKVGATVQYIQDYLPGGIEYRQTGTGVKRVESVFHAEGRYYNTNVDVSSTLAWRKEYNMKDHLGNTRLVFTDRNANGIVEITGTASTSDVLQENHYYAFGLAFEGAWLQNDATARDNAYQYNGKELNSDFGLGWNDYGARWYDASVGRWNGIDPLVGKFSSWSPYNYVMGNPIINVDPDGRNVKVNKEGNHVSISYKGAIIDESNSLSKKDVRQIRREIKSNLKSSFTGSGEGISYSIKVKLRIASSSSDLKANESSVVLADKTRPELKESYGQASDGFQAYVNATDRSNGEIAQTATHEIGHTMGLPHNVQESKKTSSTILFGIEVDNYDYLKVNAIQPGHPAAGNLMLPGTQTDACGMGVSPSQILHIFQDSKSGKLNRRDFGGGSETFGVYPSDKPIVDVYGKILKE
jgi:RHS repeat-associated protein